MKIRYLGKRACRPSRVRCIFLLACSIIIGRPNFSGVVAFIGAVLWIECIVIWEKWKTGDYGRRRYPSDEIRNQEDQAIIELVQLYGNKKWTIISHKMQFEYYLQPRTGKQCRERYLSLDSDGTTTWTRKSTRLSGLKRRKISYSRHTGSSVTSGKKLHVVCRAGSSFDIQNRQFS